MGVASGCCEQEVGVASGSGWNLCVANGVVVRRYIDFLILHLFLVLLLYLFFLQQHPDFLFMFFVLVLCNYILCIK